MFLLLFKPVYTGLHGVSGPLHRLLRCLCTTAAFSGSRRRCERDQQSQLPGPDTHVALEQSCRGRSGMSTRLYTEIELLTG